MFNINDRVVVKDSLGNEHHGSIINISNYREPCMKFAIDLDDYKDDYMFVGEQQMRKE